MRNKPPPKKCIRVVRSKAPQVIPEQSLEKMLMQLILNPIELKTKRKVLVTTPNPHGITSEIREGHFINRHGIPERIEEERIHVRTLSDGTAVGDNGLNRCQTCNAVVSVSSIKRCPCGKTCCISKRCGCYVKKHDQWYCSKAHAVLAMMKVNLRWMP